MVIFWPEVCWGRGGGFFFFSVVVEDVGRGVGENAECGVYPSFALYVRTSCFTTIFPVSPEGVPSGCLFGEFYFSTEAVIAMVCGNVEAVVGVSSWFCACLLDSGLLGTPAALGMMQDALNPPTRLPLLHPLLHPLNPKSTTTIQTCKNASQETWSKHKVQRRQ